MIKEAVTSLNGKATYPEIKAYIHKKWGDETASILKKGCFHGSHHHTKSLIFRPYQYPQFHI